MRRHNLPLSPIISCSVCNKSVNRSSAFSFDNNNFCSMTCLIPVRNIKIKQNNEEKAQRNSKNKLNNYIDSGGSAAF